jgi:maltose alpha-D-glucosyltransferase / alpha-amylase
VTVRRTPHIRYQLFDAAEEPGMAAAVLRQMRVSASRADESQLEFVSARDNASLPEDDAPRALQRVRRGSNAVFAVGDRIVLKLFRRVEAGPNPEIEIRAHLHRVGFRKTPPMVGAFRGTLDDAGAGRSAWFGILQGYVPNDGEAWQHAVAAARAWMRRAGRPRDLVRDVDTIVPMSAWDSAADSVLREVIAPYVPMVERLGLHIAELHKALASPAGNPAFRREPPTALSRRATYQRMRTLAVSVLDTLRTRLPELDPTAQELAASVLDRREDALVLFARLLEASSTSPRIRCHGNLHLGQVLHAGDALVILDFEGEPGRPLFERRMKRAPLQDVAAMVRSFHYAAHAALRGRSRAHTQAPAEYARRLRWMRAWQLRVGALFIDAYSRGVADSGLLPADPDEARVQFRAYLLERALYELGFELDNRRAWILAPLLDLPFLLPG